MKMIRNGLVVAAVGALMVLPVATAHAQTAQPVKVTSLTGAGSQGWAIDDVDGSSNDAYPYKFVAGNKPPLGTGSLQFTASDPVIAPEKMFVKRVEDISASDFRRVRFSYYFDPASTVKDPAQFYLNLYVKTATPVPNPVANWYDCKFTYTANQVADGAWRRLLVTRNTLSGPSSPANPAACASSVAALKPTDKIFLIALNAGDTTGTDAGIKGGFDDVLVKTSTSEITYDFDPAAATPPTPVKACAAKDLTPITGTTRNDTRNGTDAPEKIDLLTGNDSSDARGGADCVLGGEGNDQLKGGAGDDEIQAGPGNDLVDPGSGVDVVDAGPGNDVVNVKDGAADTVDCGAGNDVAIADPGDQLTNCETP